MAKMGVTSLLNKVRVRARAMYSDHACHFTIKALTKDEAAVEVMHVTLQLTGMLLVYILNLECFSDHLIMFC